MLSIISLSDLHRLSMTIWGINVSHAMENALSPPTTWIKLDAGDVLSLRRLGLAFVAVTEKERWRSLITEGVIGLDKGEGRVKNDSGLIICIEAHSWNGTWVTFPAVFFKYVSKIFEHEVCLFLIKMLHAHGEILYYMVKLVF